MNPSTSKEPLMEPLLLRVEDAAAMASISRSTAYSLLADGEWPYIVVGHAKRVPVDGLRAWIASRVTAAEVPQ
jgi:excisionase family DNA binding protein